MGRRKRKRNSKRSIQNPAIPLSSSAISAYLGGSAQSRSGETVSWKSALSLSPVWQAVDIITGDIARIHCHVYRDLPDGGKERATSHPVYNLLRKYTGEMTANLWFIRMVGHALLYGNAYSRIVFDGARVRRLEWLHRDCVEPDFENGEKYYLVRYDPRVHGRSGVERVSESDIFHLHGLTLDEWGGLSLVDFARNAIGRYIAAESFGDDFYRNDATPSGWFQHPGEMSEAAQKRFLELVQARHGGSGRRFRPGILEEGMQFKAAGASPSDALLIEQMEFGVKDVARFFNLPAYKLGDSSKIAYNTAQEENRAYFDSTLGKWVSRLEFESTHKLFHPITESEYYVEFDQDRWNKASTESRFKSHSIAIQWGFKTRNEVRLEENLNPVDGGDELPPMHQLGGAPAAKTTQDDSDNNESLEVDEQNEEDRQNSRDLFAKRDLLADRLGESLRLIGNAALRAAKRPGSFVGSVNDLESRFGSTVRGKLDMAVRVSVGDVVEQVCGDVFRDCENQLLSAAECPAEQLTSRVADTVSAWPEFSRNWATELILGDEINV